MRFFPCPPLSELFVQAGLHFISFHFAQNDNELRQESPYQQQTPQKPCHSEGSPNFIRHNG